MSFNTKIAFVGNSEKDLQLSFDHLINQSIEQCASFLPAEWYPQSGVQLTWPHINTDWAYILDEVERCFIQIAKEIAKRELLLIVTPNPEEVKQKIANEVNMENVRFFACDSNDTWARDHGAITMIEEEKPLLLDFMFNGWGLKFPSNLDNVITRYLSKSKTIHGVYANHLGFVLEGGSLESDGMGTILTTTECLLSPNRNGEMNQTDIEIYLKSVFHAQQILWLDHGYLAGDDTDSHIDTLARICPNDTIVYIECSESSDEHFSALFAMKEQLKTFRTLSGEPYKLLALPMADKVVFDGERLPATYANFLIINGAILYPTYQQPENDKKAAEVLQEAFPDYEIVGIDCCALIKQHGSLHCVTMQYPHGVIK